MTCVCVCVFELMCMTLTIVRLEGLWFDYLSTVAAHHQVEVILCGTLAKYWHVCAEEKN